MKILLVCNEGTSTSLVVQRMQELAKKEGKDHEIRAVGLHVASQEKLDCDVILVGPQIKFKLKTVQSHYPDIPVDAIPPQLYGRIDAVGILKLAEDMVAN